MAAELHLILSVSLMPILQTTCFGELEYPSSAVYEFPAGLPGFENERRFVFLERPGAAPLMFMHSLSNPELSFILLPILVADPQYHLTLTEEDLADLLLPPGREPGIGDDILCGGLVSVGGQETRPTVNLLAPIVLNLEKRLGMQVIQAQSGYSHRYPLFAQEELLQCS
jgi:flagellar assembly factor FliW